MDMSLTLTSLMLARFVVSESEASRVHNLNYNLIGSAHLGLLVFLHLCIMLLCRFTNPRFQQFKVSGASIHYMSVWD